MHGLRAENLFGDISGAAARVEKGERRSEVMLREINVFPKATTREPRSLPRVFRTAMIESRDRFRMFDHQLNRIDRIMH
jgi:hypothetical protein